MKFVASANFINQRKVMGKNNNIYYFAKFDDGQTGEIEVQIDSPLMVPRFALCELVVDVVQGKYPRYNALSVTDKGTK